MSMKFCLLLCSGLSLSGSGLDKMSGAKYTKMQMVNHIRRLFRLRSETFRPSTWDCVSRNGRLLVIRSFAREPDDQVIMHCFLESDQLPSLFSTYLAVRKNWQILVEANVEVSGSFDVNSLFLIASNVKTHHKGRNLLANCGRFLSRVKSFISKRIA